MKRLDSERRRKKWNDGRVHGRKGYIISGKGEEGCGMGFFGPSGGDGERPVFEIFVVNSLNQGKAN